MPGSRLLFWVRLMRILGIDPSLTSTGFAYLTPAHESIQVGTASTKLRGYERLDYLRSRVTKLLEHVKPELVVYEGYAMGIRGGRVFDLGELGGILKMEMYDRSIPVLLVPPSNLKQFVTGNGGAKGKELMMTTLARHRGRLFAKDDEADAYGLVLMGRAWKNPRLRPRAREHHANRALRGCQIVG